MYESRLFIFLRDIDFFFIRIIIVLVTYQRKINSNQQIGLGGAACQTPDPTAIILTGCRSRLGGLREWEGEGADTLWAVIGAARHVSLQTG